VPIRRAGTEGTQHGRSIAQTAVGQQGGLRTRQADVYLERRRGRTEQASELRDDTPVAWPGRAACRSEACFRVDTDRHGQCAGRSQPAPLRTQRLDELLGGGADRCTELDLVDEDLIRHRSGVGLCRKPA
jgi:hypothetical protein